jgi:hypothetical protein
MSVSNHAQYKILEIKLQESIINVVYLDTKLGLLPYQNDIYWLCVCDNSFAENMYLR